MSRGVPFYITIANIKKMVKTAIGSIFKNVKPKQIQSVNKNIENFFDGKAYRQRMGLKARQTYNKAFAHAIFLINQHRLNGVEVKKFVEDSVEDELDTRQQLIITIGERFLVIFKDETKC